MLLPCALLSDGYMQHLQVGMELILINRGFGCLMGTGASMGCHKV